MLRGFRARQSVNRSSTEEPLPVRTLLFAVLLLATAARAGELRLVNGAVMPGELRRVEHRAPC